MFGLFKKKPKNNFRITDEDRFWVEDNYIWLVQVFGIPKPTKNPITISQMHFPNAFEKKESLIESIKQDLCQLLSIDASKIKFENHTDLRDIPETPYEFDENPFETQLEIFNNAYIIHIAQSINNHPNRLFFRLILECTKIKLIEEKLDFGEGEESDLFIYLASLFLGFGIPMFQNLNEKGMSVHGLWEQTWHFNSPMPKEVMAFALALNAELSNQQHSDWLEDLSLDLKNLYLHAREYLKENHSSEFTSDLHTYQAIYLANVSFNNKETQKALTILEETIKITDNNFIKAEIYNTIGYIHLFEKKYELSIEPLETAISLNPQFGYPYNNLGLAFIRLGKLEEGKIQIEKSMQCEIHHLGYVYRNLAIYYWKKEELDLAKEHFEMAFRNRNNSVHDLEFDYSQFLFETGDITGAKKYLNLAIQEGHLEAEEILKELQKL